MPVHCEFLELSLHSTLDMARCHSQMALATGNPEMIDGLQLMYRRVVNALILKRMFKVKSPSLVFPCICLNIQFSCFHVFM